jgi:membrane protein implicated in regulation of membrane protease activity
VVVAWVLAGVVLLLFEMHHLAFYALFLAIGAFAAAVVSAAAPDAYAVQAAAFVGLSVVGVVGARPFVSQAFHHRRGGHVALGVHGGIVGQQAVTLDQVGDVHQIGHVRLAGERWLAVTGGQKIEPGQPVVVTAVRGTTLEVWPVDELQGGFRS